VWTVGLWLTHANATVDELWRTESEQQSGERPALRDADVHDEVDKQRDADEQVMIDAIKHRTERQTGITLGPPSDTLGPTERQTGTDGQQTADCEDDRQLTTWWQPYQSLQIQKTWTYNAQVQCLQITFDIWHHNRHIITHWCVYCVHQLQQNVELSKFKLT